MGSGRLTPTNNLPACPFLGRWTGFPRNTHVVVRVSRQVSNDNIRAIRQTAAQVATATSGAVTADVELTDDPNPLPSTNEVTSTAHPDPVSQGCPFDRGCTIHSFLTPGILRSSRSIQPFNLSQGAYAHDVIGHGILGMCHIDGNLIGGADRSLMSSGPNVFSGQLPSQLTGIDIEAIQAVYSSNLSPGATRSDFVRVGLIDP
jgi:hypothetical protein